MNKTEFIALLLTKGYDVVDDNGAVMVVVDEGDLTKAHDEVYRLARKHEYMNSWGVRIKRCEQSI